MMERISEHLNYLGYHVNEKFDLNSAIEGGAKSQVYTHIVSWLTKELQVLNELESCVNHTEGPEDASNFLLEVSSFLKDMNCPYTCLMEGPVSQRLFSRMNKEILLEFLCTELEAARINTKKKPSEKAMQVEMQESDTAKALKEALIALGFGKPPPTITPMKLFSEVESKVGSLIKANKECHASEPLFTGTLSEKQYFALQRLQEQMYEDYTTRREMLLKRLGVTVESFTWSDRLKDKREAVKQMYLERIKGLHSQPSVDIPDLLAARKDLLMVEKTSSGSVRRNTKSSVNKVVIGAVPDRGGRPDEQQPPPPEVPSWQKTDTQKQAFDSQRSFSNRMDSGHAAVTRDAKSTSEVHGSFRNQGGSGRSRGRGDHFRGGNNSIGANVGGYDHRGRGASGFRGNQHTGFQGGRNPASSGADPLCVNFVSQNQAQPVFYASSPFVSGPEMATQFYSTGVGEGHVPEHYGIGVGGYSATGGNFYQFGTVPDHPEQRSYSGRGRGRGGNRRGGRNR